MLFYGSLEQEFAASRQRVLERAGVARLELGRTPDRERLDVLLERLRRDTALPSTRRPGTTARFAATVTVSVTTQLRKILEVAAEIRAHALLLAKGALLSEIYARLARFCAQQREEMQGRLYVLNQLAARCTRAEQTTQRAARGALTYRRGRREALVERLEGAVRAAVRVPTTPEVIARLGGDLLAFRAEAPDALDRLLEAIPVDETQLMAATDAVLAGDPDLTSGLRAAQAQLFPGAQVDRDAPRPPPAAARSSSSARAGCTRRTRRTSSPATSACETSDSYAVLMVQHETGLRFMALSYLRRIQGGLRGRCRRRTCARTPHLGTRGDAAGTRGVAHSIPIRPMARRGALPFAGGHRSVARLRRASLARHGPGRGHPCPHFPGP